MSTPELPDAETSLDEVVSRIRHLLAVVEGYSDPTLRRTVFDLLDWFDTLHREGLERLAAGLQSVGFLDKALDDPVVAHLFALYELVDTEDPRPLVEAALEEIRPYVNSHGGEMTVASIDSGVVSVRMHGACSGCPSSVVTLTQSFERAIRSRWAGLVRIEIDDDHDPRWQSVTIGKRG